MGDSEGQGGLACCSLPGGKESDRIFVVTSLSFFTFMHWRRKWKPTPAFWPGEFRGLYSPCGRKESDMTERLHFTSPLSR